MKEYIILFCSIFTLPSQLGNPSEQAKQAFWTECRLVTSLECYLKMNEYHDYHQCVKDMWLYPPGMYICTRAGMHARYPSVIKGTTPTPTPQYKYSDCSRPKNITKQGRCMGRICHCRFCYHSVAAKQNLVTVPWVQWESNVLNMNFSYKERWFAEPNGEGGEKWHLSRIVASDFSVEGAQNSILLVCAVF